MNQDHIIKCGKDQDWIGLAAQESPNRLIEWPGPLPYFHIIGPFLPEGGFVRTPRTPLATGLGLSFTSCRFYHKTIIILPDKIDSLPFTER